MPGARQAPSIPGYVIVAGEGRAIVQASAQDVLEFALDIDRYRWVDPRFRKVYRHRSDGDAGEICYSGTLRGIPAPPDTKCDLSAPR